MTNIWLEIETYRMLCIMYMNSDWYELCLSWQDYKFSYRIDVARIKLDIHYERILFHTVYNEVYVHNIYVIVT